jgi:outer membrane lipoprotein-sorting protein
MRLWAVLSAVWLLVAMEAQSHPILRDWISKQSDLRSLRAEFEQTRRLPALRLPLKRTGTVWLDSQSRFRWQVGDPAELIAIGSPDRILLVDPKKKRARILSNGVAAGPLRFDMIRLPFAKSYEEFEKAFEVLELRENGPRVDVSMKPKDPSLAAGVKSIRVVFKKSDGMVELLELDLRDGGQITTVMKAVESNPVLAPEIFDFDLAGFAIDDRSGGAAR